MFKTQVLQKLEKQYLTNTLTVQACFDAAHTIGGDFEKAGVLRALIANDNLSSNSFNQLLLVAGHINSAYEKSTTLVTIAGKMPTDAKIREAYMTTAKTIGSTYDYEQTVKAVK